MTKLEKQIEAWIEPTIQQAGYQLYDVYYIKEGKDYYLKVFLTKPEGDITLEDCEKVSNILNPLLDEKQELKDQYFLEVSSTGIERVLRKEEHLQQAIGEKVQVGLYQPVQKQKTWVGILQEVNPQTLMLQIEEQALTLERANIANVKIYYDWDNT